MRRRTRLGCGMGAMLAAMTVISPAQAAGKTITVIVGTAKLAIECYVYVIMNGEKLPPRRETNQNGILTLDKPCTPGMQIAIVPKIGGFLYESDPKDCDETVHFKIKG